MQNNKQNDITPTEAWKKYQEEHYPSDMFISTAEAIRRIEAIEAAIEAMKKKAK